jgi:GNAT superfamily N-acetyltransferase
MRSRPITGADIASCQAIFNASFDDLHRRYGLEEEPADPGWLRPILVHFLDTDPQGGRIAMQDDVPVAFASTIRRGDFWFLSFLFVLPDAQGQGLGRGLMRELLPKGEGVVRATVVESFQPASTGLYASFGMTPRSFKYWLSELSRPEALPPWPVEIGKAELTTADLAEVNELDRRVLGFTRPADHAWWAEAGTPCFVFRRGDELVAYAYVDDGYVGPALATDETTLCSVVADIVRTADDPGSMAVNVCGDSAGVFKMLVGAGARIDDAAPYRFAYCSNIGPLPASYIHHSDWLP